MGTYDVIVIGSGPGGYVCALRAAQLGLKVACIEKHTTPGGTCLNVGCIPSKSLLYSTHLLDTARHNFASHGILGSENLSMDLGTMMDRKEKVVEGLARGVASLFRKNGVEYIVGIGQIEERGQVRVGMEVLSSGSIVVASGSESALLPGLQIDEEYIVTSTGALSLKKVPSRLAIIGAGPIGLELGSVWLRLGSEVTIIEYYNHILPSMDGEIRQQMQRILERQGLKFRLGHQVLSARKTASTVTLQVIPLESQIKTPETLTADVLLVAAGRRPYTVDLNLEHVGVKLDTKGFIIVDHMFRTNIAGIYAIGDVIGGNMLAHKAAEEGILVAEQLAGHKNNFINYHTFPSVVYTWPEVASTGQTEESLRKAGTNYKIGKFPFSANARARCNGEEDGFVKILSESRTDKILGAHIIGPLAGDIISEISLGLEFSSSSEDIARTCHAHPSFAEAIREASLAVANNALHI